MAELKEAVLDVQKLVSKLVKGKQPEEIQPIPTFASLHPQTTIQHTCNAQASPEIMEGIKTMSNTINSMASQMATMQSTISKMEKQLSGKNTQTITPPMTQQPSQQPSQPPQNTFIPRIPTPRTQTPRVPTPNPFQNQTPPTPMNAKPNRRKGRAELYEDQFGNACNADLSVGTNWFIKAVQTAPDIQIHYWCLVINAGNWGYLGDKGFPSRCLPDLGISCKRNFILLSIMRAFNSNTGCHRFLTPPHNPINTTDTNEMCNFYSWTFFSGIRENPPMRKGRITPAYYPGWNPDHVKALLDQRSKMGKLQAQKKPKTVSFAQAVSQTKPPPNNTTMGAQPFFTPTPLPPAPQSNGAEYAATFHNEEVFFEDLYGSIKPAPITTTVPKGGATFAAAAAGQNKPNKPIAPTNPKTKRPAFQHRQIYTLRFSRELPWKGVQTPAHIVVDKINVACKKSYNIKAILARWTKKNNLTVTFTNKSKDKNIDNAAKTIINLLAQGYTHVSFAKPAIWNKIVYRQIPCRAITDEELNGDAMNQGQLWTKEQLLKEVKDSHPLLKDVTFAYNPDWTMAEVPDEADHWNICFTIIDPDDSIANQIVESNIIMFATVIIADHWKERINLQQCNICWQLTGPHKACMQHQDGKVKGCETCRKSCVSVCRICGSKAHREDQHNKNCRQCIQTGEAIETIKSKDWKCTHLRCAVCAEGHFSDSLEFGGRNVAIQQARGRKPNYGQPLLKPESFQQRYPPAHPAYPSSYPEQGPNNSSYILSGPLFP